MCLLAVLRPARPRDAVADTVASFLRPVATVPPLIRLACSPCSSCREAGRCRAVWSGWMRFFLVGFLRGRVLFFPYLCYNVCRGDGDLRMGGIRASVSYASPPYWGRRVLFAFIDTASPLLLYPRRSSLLNRPAFLYDKRGDFFLPTHHHAMPAPCLLALFRVRRR